MAELVVEGNQLTLRLSWWERILAGHGNVEVLLSSVSSVRAEACSADLLRWLFRQDAFGPAFLQVPYGVRLDYFVAAHRRRPAVFVGLDPPSRFRGLLVSVADPQATAARIMDAKDERRGGAGKLLMQVRARRLWLPWRPRLRLIVAWPRGLAYVAAGLHRFDLWVGRHGTGWLRPVMTAVLLLAYLFASLLGVALVFEITIIAFAASVYLVLAEWLLLALMLPIALAARLASLEPWPLIAVAGRQWWTARVAGWSASGKAVGAAAGALTSDEALASPPWSPRACAAQIWK